MDKLIKGTMSTLADGDNITFPLKGMAVYLEKISMDSTSMSKEINLSYPCPCGTSYSPTTTSTDPQALDGSINPTSASTITADKQTQTSTTTTASKSKAGQKLSFSTASGMCSVKVPSLNTMSSDISSWKSMMVAVIIVLDVAFSTCEFGRILVFEKCLTTILYKNYTLVIAVNLIFLFFVFSIQVQWRNNQKTLRLLLW